MKTTQLQVLLAIIAIGVFFNGPSTTVDCAGGKLLQKSRFVTGFQYLPQGWAVSLQITPLGTQNGWSNIMHATIGGNSGRYGDRTPGIWFHSETTRLHICSAVNGNPNFCYDSSPLPLNRTSRVTVQQVQSEQNYKYYYQIYINGKRVRSIGNRDPRVFRNVKYFAADGWHNPANAKINNFQVTIFKDRRPINLRRKRFFTTIRTLPRGWRVMFDIMPLGIQKGWSNIMHATTGGNIAKYGDRTPGIWFRPGTTKLHIASAISGNKNYNFDTKRSLPLNKYSRVAVMQTQVGDSPVYLFRVFINKKLVFSVENKKAATFNYVKYFTSDLWHVPAEAKIKDFAVSLFPHRG